MTDKKVLIDRAELDMMIKSLAEYSNEVRLLDEALGRVKEERKQLRELVKKLTTALEQLVKMYVTPTFIICITPPSVSEMTKRDRKRNRTWAAWDYARMVLAEVSDAGKAE